MNTAGAVSRKFVAGPDRGRTYSRASVIVALLFVASCFLVIYSTHACRDLYAQLQTLESERWHLQEEFGRLVLEQSTWASHYRVEKVARTDLGMVAPSLDKFRVIEK